MVQVRKLFSAAVKDFETAKKHARSRNYATASILYARAAKNLLRALFISTERRTPPKNASMTYLNRRLGMATETDEIDSALADDEREELEEEAVSTREKSGDLSRKEELVRNLIGYTWTRLNGR
ncbi:MAG: HEPN domain-containing protein [Candidatus Marsarchaeota archaeon]|jgi:HEPN domain-containing protein|nr:HEPN domain-containing protein [Candidatus Marsarchaeota archaeon]